MMYKSKILKIDPYDWFCGPGSQIINVIVKVIYKNVYYCFIIY